MVGAVGGGGCCPVVPVLFPRRWIYDRCLQIGCDTIFDLAPSNPTHLPAPFPPRANHDPSTRLCD